ncbi:MAG: NAD-glutamate dehydrogenase [bacterium]|nr:NAD-glutamate dehydrogenase [bacterium]
MAFSKEQLKSELVEQALELVHRSLAGEQAADADRFLRSFYQHVPPDEILAETPENLYGAALTLWRFARRRAAGESKVRVYNPRHDSHGWKSAHTVVEIVIDDMPFLVDSVTAAFQSLSAEVHLIVYPVLYLRRDDEGRLLEVVEAAEGAADADGASAEALMHFQISEQPAVAHEILYLSVSKVLADVRAAVEDWPEMCARCAGLIEEIRRDPPPLPEEEVAEGTAFLEWLGADNFTFLGARDYVFDGEGAAAVARVAEGSGLGILRDEATTIFAESRSLGPMPADVRSFLRRPELLVISKAGRRATVHRPVHLDAISAKTIDATGEVVGHRLFVGLFTSVAYAARPGEIPLLRRKVQNVLERSRVPLSGHGGKALVHILDTYSRDELFQVTEEKLYEIGMGILHLQERQRIAFFPRRDTFERFVSCLVYVPRDRYDTRLRLKLQEILSAAYEGEVSDYYTYLTDAKLARLHLIIQTTPGKIPEVDEEALERKLAEAGRSWTDRLQQALIESRGEEQGIATMHRFGEAFSASYQDHFNAQTGVSDVASVEQALEEGLALNLYRPIEVDDSELRLKVYLTGKRVPLSEVLPKLENMGLKVIDEIPYGVRPADLEHPVWIRDFVMRTEDGETADLGVGRDGRSASLREAFHEAFRLIWHGRMENDGFNRLVLCAGLSAREVTVLRAICKYLLQARIPFSQTYMEQTLAGNPEIARLLVRLFRRRFDPEPDSESGSAGEDEISDQIERLLDEVTHLDEDRIIRRFRNFIRSALRTNYFQIDGGGDRKPYLSFKLDSQRLSELPLPRPFREIFVYGSRLEAVHLRGGPVARGGIRWSDRREDFRTEVLGLMKAQMVKNTVIVPVGSKGGFVVKQPPEGDREALMKEVVQCYRTMMQGILDLTDNLEGGEVVPPRQVVRHDDDDPYLVVAADKGTATFSDIANGISEENGFWLGDAFASGGSAGYDHKKMGITARGAWESVKRHFRELGKDIQAEDFTCVGVGDMSGDVFGNGMLLSKHTRLLAAFNHLHVFVDPDPDSEASWGERKRLFELPRSSWGDYDRALISSGGGVFERSAKAVELTPEIRETFGFEQERVTPAELVRGLLTAEVELLWFGGIGTYVKASGETDAMVGDRANDPLRVDAGELRAGVVGEGANLGMTQRARIEYGQLGGRLNTDSIDNSAGVDTSDHEVNIKILLGEVEAAGDMTRKQRNELLKEMTDEVADLVLRDNYLQTQAITVTHRLGPRLLDRTARFIRAQERSGRLDRKIEFLPDDETLAERMQRGKGFTRSEIAVLLSYAKMELYDQLLASDLPDEPYMTAELERYFPRPLREGAGRPIRQHRLRREIIATVVTNDIVNRVGITFLHEVKERTGMAAADIARAYLLSREIFGMREMWRRIEELDNLMPASVQASMLAECGRLIERGAVWFLREEAGPLDIGGQVERYASGVQAVGEGLETLLSEGDGKVLGERVASYVEEGAPEEVASMAARLPLLAPGCDIVRIALDAGVGVGEVGKVYFATGSRLGFDWLRRAALHLPSESAWDKLAITAIVDDLYGHQSDLTRRVIENAGAGDVDETAIDRWAEGRRSQVSQTEHLLAELQSLASPSLSMLAVANRQLKSLST